MSVSVSTKWFCSDAFSLWRNCGRVEWFWMECSCHTCLCYDSNQVVMFLIYAYIKHLKHIKILINMFLWSRWFAKRFLHPDIILDYEYIFLWDEDLGVDHFHAGRYRLMSSSSVLHVPAIKYNLIFCNLLSADIFRLLKKKGWRYHSRRLILTSPSCIIILQHETKDQEYTGCQSFQRYIRK